MCEIVFYALGAPRGKQRPRMARRGRKTITYTPQETLEYERTIREAFLLAALREQLPLTGPLVIDVVAIFPRTKALSVQRKDGTYKHDTGRLIHAVKPDGDNVLKAVQDAIGDYIEGGDSRIVRASVTKLYGAIDESAGTIVRIKSLDLPKLMEQVSWSSADLG